jgi:hypothetical protein
MATFWTPAAGDGYWGTGTPFPIACESTYAVSPGAGTVGVKFGPGELIEAVVTSAGTAGDNLSLYDSQGPGAPLGNLLAVIPGGTAVGTLVLIDAPFSIGLAAVSPAGGPSVTLGFD